MKLVDVVYFVVISVMMVGYGDMLLKMDEGKVFVMVLFVMGVVIVGVVMMKVMDWILKA